MCGYPILSYFEESDRQTIDVGMRTLLFHPLVLRGRFCKRGGAGRLRLRKRNEFHAEGQVCAHGPSSGAVGHGVPPAYGRSVSRSNLDGIRAAPVGTARVLPNDGADVIAAYKKRSDAAASDRFRIGSGI
jgi:hypothetical protein